VVKLELHAQAGNAFMLQVHAATSSSASYATSGCCRLSRGNTRRGLGAAGKGVIFIAGSGSNAACSSISLAAGRSRVVACTRTLPVTLYNGALSSCSYSDFLSGLNAAYLGGEVIYFRNASRSRRTPTR
jgi:hypothetical protein